MKNWFIIAFLTCCFNLLQAQIIYVNITSTGANDGTSWASAYVDLQDAIDAATATDEIWVAQGIYRPTKDRSGNPAVSSINATFYIDHDVKIYGGFIGSETSLAQRNLATNQTTLDGDVGTPNDASDNSLHVLYLEAKVANGGITNNTIIDGFIIENGNAQLSQFSGLGGAMIVDARGTDNTANYLLRNCELKNNQANVGGGAIYNLADGAGQCNPTYINCVFANNSTNRDGGAVYNSGLSGGQANPTINNCTFYENTATQVGGAIYNDGSLGASNPSITNCIFWENKKGNPLSNSVAGADIENSASGAAPVVTYSLTQENSIYASGTGIINNEYPLFEDAANCDFNVQSCSPVINAGITPNPILSTDIVGNNRDANYDFGAYEFQGNPVFYNGNGIVYVDIDVSGGNQSGSDWTNAFTNLQDALDLIQENDCVAAREIWVAEGTYKPTKDNPASSNNTARDVSFYIDTDSIRIYGGFQGVETMRTQRNISLYKTILSGDLNDNDTPNLSGTALRNDASRNDNAYTIFYFDGTTVKGSITAATVVDGFTIEGGNANSSISVALGGAIYNDGNNGQSSPTISACSFARNNALRGGAIYNNGENGQSNPIISACSFDNNHATVGGAIYNGGNFGISNPVISNCIFTSNTVIDRGGAIYSNGQGGESSPVINSCRFTNNSVPFSGGALYFFGDGGNIQAQITNCIFQNNGADHIGYDDGDANQDPDFINCTFEGASEQAVNIRFFDSGQTPIDFTNCIFWNNTSLTNNDAAINPQNCIVGDDNNVFAGSNGNLNQDPLFVDAANGDLTLQICSPAIDSGDNIAIDTFSMDFLGNTRIVNGTVDIGAYEFQGIAYTGTGIIYIDQDASSGNNSGSDWTNAFTDLQDALDLIQENSCITAREIWVAEGTYKPTKDNPASSDNTARDVSFYIDTDSIRIYGGFQGTETMRAQRNFTTYPTVLSGDLNNDDTPNLSGTALSNDASRSDNAYTILYIDGTTGKGSITNTTVIDGFMIKGGNANNELPISTRSGGAIFNNGLGGVSSPIISNCSFTENIADFGGAIFNEGAGGVSSPTISNCSFTNNTATENGGAIFNDGSEGLSSPIISNCSFTNNTANVNGGAIDSEAFNGVSEPTISNCDFINNTSGRIGGALYFFGDGGNIQAQITNCIFQNNGSDHIGYDDGNANQDPNFVNCTFEVSEQAIIIDFFDSGRTPIDFINCIFWDNTSITNNNAAINPQNCIVGDDSNVFAGNNGNFNQDPLFVDAANGDLSLQVCSPAIDAGDNVAIDTFSTDFAGNTRIINGTVDIGAYERQDLTLPDLLGIVSIQASDSLFTGADTIQTIGTVTVAAMDTIIFEGAEAVVLKAGFSAEAGSDFTARIGQCGVPADNNMFNEAVVEQRSEPQDAVVPINKVFTKKQTSLIAYPNPFSHQTTIEFELPQTSSVYLAIYDSQGRTVANLYANTILDQGTHQVPFQANDLDTGIYLIRLQTDEQLQTFKLIVQE